MTTQRYLICLYIRRHVLWMTLDFEIDSQCYWRTSDSISRSIATKSIYRNKRKCRTRYFEHCVAAHPWEHDCDNCLSTSMWIFFFAFTVTFRFSWNSIFGISTFCGFPILKPLLWPFVNISDESWWEHGAGESALPSFSSHSVDHCQFSQTVCWIEDIWHTHKKKKPTQLVHNIVCVFIFFLSAPRHVSASNYAIIKGATSKLYKMCMNVTVKY
jgi:hypothetical protein